MKYTHKKFNVGPTSATSKEFDDNWERTFGKKERFEEAKGRVFEEHAETIEALAGVFLEAGGIIPDEPIDIMKDTVPDQIILDEYNESKE